MPLTQIVAKQISLAENADNLNSEYAAQEKALNACQNLEDWQACLDAFGERVVGSYIADNQEGMASNDMGDGCAYLGMDAVGTEDEMAAYVEWNDQGFYSVSFVPAREARGAIDSANEEWSETESED